MSQLMVGLPYRHEDRFDTAIRYRCLCVICVAMTTCVVGSKLQDQLQTAEYSPSEEKRLRTEVEDLQKGKQSLK